MAIGTQADLTIYETLFHTSFTETLQQETAVFNGASNGAIVMTARNIMGHYEQSTMWRDIVGLVERRDTDSVAALTPELIPDDENISVKVNRKTKLMSMTKDAFRKRNQPMDEFVQVLGQQYAKAAMVDYVNTCLLCGVAAIGNNADAALPAIAATATHTNLVDGKYLFGDQAGRINLFVMHSKVHGDLLKLGIADQITNVADVVINNGTIGVLGAPALIVDSPSLLVPGAPDTYNTLGLAQGALSVIESEEKDFGLDTDITLENTAMQYKNEWAYNLSVKGYKWDIANGGENPADAALSTGTNWLSNVSDVKSSAGVLINTQ